MNSPLSERISDLSIPVKQLICIVSGTSGSASGTYYVITATSMLTPRTNWMVLSTNSHDNAGKFSATNPIGSRKPQQFYQIKQKFEDALGNGGTDKTVPSLKSESPLCSID